MTKGDEFDPLSIVWAPPAEETSAERALREQRETEAKRVSDRIDEDIRVERAALKKQKNILRILLLGQAESGKSTTLKNFRLKYANQQWMEERHSWRAVIQLNLIRSIITILDALQAEFNGDPIVDVGEAEEDETDVVIGPSSSEIPSQPKQPSTILLDESHQVLAMRLAPIRRLEGILRQRLGIMADEVRDAAPEEMHATPFDPPTFAVRQRRKRELTVRCWSDALAGPSSGRQGGRPSSGGGSARSSGDKVTEVLINCKQDLVSLWRDEGVRAVLQKRRVTIEESSGFFLDDQERIASASYEPTDDDVVRARLRTVGVQEHRIVFEQGAIPSFSIGMNPLLTNFACIHTRPAPSSVFVSIERSHTETSILMLGHEFGKEWLIYDVGGSRTTRQAWLPYFDHVNAVIFLAPVSCFDERLDEDTSINRLEDSFLLWKSVVSTPLLKNATMIVFLNKCDLLKKKLKRGVMVNKHMPSYGDRPNDAQSVVKYLREKFKDLLKQHSPEYRVGYLYPTSVTDTKATSATLKSVRDGILREHLKNANFV